MEEDFSECEFIHKQMRYYTYDDFYVDRKVIKKLFNNLNKNGKRFYMWYVYANTHMSLKMKNAVWDYLNDFKNEEQLKGIKGGFNGRTN